MLVAIATTIIIILICGRSPSVGMDYHQTESQIKKYITDDARRKQALDIVDEMEKTARESAREQEKSTKDLRELFDVRTTPAEQIDMATRPLIDNDHATADKLLDLRFQLKGVLTPAEWGEVFPAPTTAPADTSK